MLITVILFLFLIWGLGLFIFTVVAGYKQYKSYSKHNKDLFWINFGKGKFFIYLMFSLILIFNSLYFLL